MKDITLDSPLAKKVREVTYADFVVIKERLTGGQPPPNYSKLRDEVAIQLGLTKHQVGTVRMHILNRNQPRR